MKAQPQAAMLQRIPKREKISVVLSPMEDPNNDTLTYSLGGTNAVTFDIDETNGQLKTKAPLDFEFKSTYTVTITVTDSVDRYDHCDD